MSGKPGRINVCCDPDCQARDAREAPEPDLEGGNMIWYHKTASVLERKPLSRAVVFASQTRRFGAGVTQSLTCGKELAYAQLMGQPYLPKFGIPDGASKSGTGAESGAQYISPLGEKRSVK